MNAPVAKGSRVSLFAITDAARFPNFVNECESLCRGAREGTVGVVLRERAVSVRQQCEWGQQLREVTSRFGQLLFISERADLAQLVGADGVHLPAAGLAPGQISTDTGLVVSRSGHELEILEEEDWRRLSAVWISPVVAPRKGRAPLGEAGLRERTQWVQARAPHVSVYALGGVSGEEAASCLRAGATGVAAIGAAWDRTARERLLSVLEIQRAPGVRRGG